MTSAAIYARISNDSEGQEAGVTRQIEDARALAARDGFEIPDEFVFCDNDISASTRSSKPRPRFDDLLDAVRTRGVRQVYAYSASRLTRRPSEFETLIRLTEDHGVQYRLVTGNLDFNSADSRAAARAVAAFDTAEAERIGERVKRQKKQRAEQGLPQGGRYPTFGFTREWTVVEDEAERLREAFQRRASGESVSSIAASIGLSQSTLAKELANPIYIGRRSYKGEVVGDLHEGFPRLIDPVVFQAVQAVGETAPAGTNTRRYLLSGIARCGDCQSRMKGAPSSGRASRYRCASTYGGCGKVSIRCDWIDDPVMYAAVAREVFQRGEGRPTAPNPADFNVEADAARQDIADVQAAVKARTITMATALPLLSEAEERLRAVEREQRRAAVQAVSPNWAYESAVELFALPLGQLRALLARHLVAVEIESAPTRGRNSMDLSRVVLHWTDGSAERLSNSVPA